MHPDHPMRHGCPPDWADGFGCDEYGPYAEVYVDDATLRMRWIPPGTFEMGSPEGEDGRLDWELKHAVKITQGYWLADAPLTQLLWQTVTGENPSHFNGPDRPVDTVSWDDVQSFIEQLNTRDPEFEARLPTEAEWEYACRAGTTTARYGELDEVAWYTKNSGGETHPVRQKQPNAWGLYDMLGNVREWCADWYGRYQSGASKDPEGPEEGSSRVFRGGSWGNSAGGVRAAYRGWITPGLRNRGLGVRLSIGPAPSARSAEPPRSGPGGAESRGERPWSRAEGSRVSGGAAVPEADPGSGAALQTLKMQFRWSAWWLRDGWLMREVECRPESAVYLLWYRVERGGGYETVAIGVDEERRCLKLYEVWHDTVLNIGETPWGYVVRAGTTRTATNPRHFRGIVHTLVSLPEGRGKRFELYASGSWEPGLEILGVVARRLIMRTHIGLAEEAPRLKALDLRTTELKEVPAWPGAAEFSSADSIRTVDPAKKLNLQQFLAEAPEPPEAVRRFLAVRNEGFLGWSPAPTSNLEALSGVLSRRYALRFGALAHLISSHDEVKAVFDGSHPRSKQLMAYADREVAKTPWQNVLSNG